MIDARVANYSGLVLNYCDARYWSINYLTRLWAMSPVHSSNIVRICCAHHCGNDDVERPAG